MARVGAQKTLPPLLALLTLLALGIGATLADELSTLSAFKANLSGPLLPSWNSSTPLCSWPGITCNANFSVTAINLSGCNLTGEVDGDIFLQLSYLESVDLSNNKISSHIPNVIFSSASLRYLNLSNNNLTGPIPSAAAAAGLETLDLSNNALTGNIPESIGLFTKLKCMDIGGNLLVSEVPETLANMTSLQVLTLASNQLTGLIPRGLSNMKKLRFLYLGYNNFSGQIPEEIGLLISLNHLDLVFNNLSGEIPSSFGNLSNLQYLFLYQNSLSGPIPESVFGLKKLISLDLSDNLLVGEVSELLGQLQELEILQLFSNRLSGKIPSAVAYLPRLRVLQLWNNKFTGRMPAKLGKHCNLTVLDLSTNFLTGKVPEYLCHSSHLSKVILFSNSIIGRIPKGLGLCKTLSRVRLENNSLSGEIPEEFWRLPLVNYLDISGNKLTGRIDEVKWDMKSLKMLKMGRNKFSGGLPEYFGCDQGVENLDISDNNLSGGIPRSIGNMSQLVQLKLGGNKLTGTIPSEMSLCRELVYLDLSRNQLSGQIPESIGALPVLEELNLSENELSGEIPSILGEMDSLVKVNVSHNHLHGSLPLGGPFLAIESSAVLGNNLCEYRPKTSGLPQCQNGRNIPTQWWLLGLGVIIVLVVGFFAFLLVVFLVRRRDGSEPQRVKSEDGLWEVQFFNSKSSKAITFDDILSEDHKEKNMVAKGSNWLSYKGKSKASGKEFIVTHWNGLNSISSILWTALTELGRNPNQKAVKMIGICRSELNGCLILHECDEGRSLLEALPSLNWEARKNLARGLANALQAVHSCTHVPIVDLSPEKIYVDDDNEPSLHVILPATHDQKDLFADDQSLNSAAYSTVTEGVARREDIYSFGMILMVLLSGKFPSDSKFGQSQKTIVEWAHSFRDLSGATWLDSRIKERVAHNELMDITKLALMCTAKDPAQRPSATEVYELLNSLETCCNSLDIMGTRNS